MSLALIVGLGIFCLILLYFSNSLAVEHTILKILAYFFIFTALLLLGKALVDSGETCELVLNGTTEIYIYGNNFDGYHWDGYNITAPSQIDKEAFLFHKNITNTYDTICYDNNTFNTGVFSYRLFLGFFVLFCIYVFFYFSYNVLNWAGKGYKKK